MILDLQVLNDLKKMNESDEDDFFCELLETFKNEIPELQNEILEAYKEKNLLKMVRVSHSLKGASLNLGACDLASICQKIEVSGKDNNLENIDNLILELESTLNQTLKKLEDFKDTINRKHKYRIL